MRFMSSRTQARIASIVCTVSRPLRTRSPSAIKHTLKIRK